MAKKNVNIEEKVESTITKENDVKEEIVENQVEEKINDEEKKIIEEKVENKTVVNIFNYISDEDEYEE